MEEPALTVQQLNEMVRNLLSNSPDVTNVWVRGEISGLKLSNGHFYFTLKDSSSEIACALFKNRADRLSFTPKENMKVICFGDVDLWVPRGRYQFMVQAMTLDGIGERYLQLEELKKKLKAEGILDRPKRRLPVYPRVIGVVTSETGAVIHDIVRTASLRCPADIMLVPVQVQGEGAAKSIAAGIELLNRVGVDVIIVGRGGGSVEDLWAFNEEVTVRAIAASKIPTISAVGHESDFTLADSVADVRAATPTAAAQIALRDKTEILRQLDVFGVRADRSLASAMKLLKARFDALDSKLNPENALNRIYMLGSDVDDLSSRVTAVLRESITGMRARYIRAEAFLGTYPAGMFADGERRFEFVSARLDSVPEKILTCRRAALENISGRLGALDPYQVLGRGYSMITDGSGKALTSAKKVRKGGDITVRLRDGSVDAQIKEVRLNDRREQTDI